MQPPPPPSVGQAPITPPLADAIRSRAARRRRPRSPRAPGARPGRRDAAPPPLADFVGVYDYAAGATIEIIAADVLFAVLDDAKYRLRRVGPDTFVNGTGDTIPFRRDARGAVTGFVERGTLYRRRAARPSAASEALAVPRPPGSGAYRYRAPVDRGALRGVDEPVFPRLPYGAVTAYEHPDPRKARLTLGDLLTMRPGLACDDHDGRSPGRETALYERPDWVKATLDLPMVADPGTAAHYCSGGVAVAGRVVERAVGAALPDFADSALFRPLGIARASWRWNYRLTNANREFAQLHLRPRDMLKLGLLYADGGRWRGRQVLSASWVAASLAAQTELENTGYGYYWWRPWLRVATPGGDVRVTFSAAQGNGGQKIYLVPQYDLVAVFTGGAYNVSGTPPNAMMAGVILPPLVNAGGR